jgi:hypothetical protein
MVAAAGLGLDPGRILLVPDPSPAWPQVTASLLDGCELALLRPPEPATAQVQRRLEATLRRGRGVLLIAGDWPGPRCASKSSPAGGPASAAATAAAGMPRGGQGRRSRGRRGAADPLALAARRGRHGHCGRPGGRPPGPPGGRSAIRSRRDLTCCPCRPASASLCLRGHADLPTPQVYASPVFGVDVRTCMPNSGRWLLGYLYVLRRTYRG